MLVCMVILNVLFGAAIYATSDLDITTSLFASAPRHQVFHKERIYEAVWGLDGLGNANVVAEHIRRIRVKLSAVSEKTYIETVWGVGYKWVA